MDFDFKNKFMNNIPEFAEGMLPYFRAKFKQDKLSIGGKTIPYEQFTCFGVVDGNYVPYYALKGNCKVINLFHCISIGMAEVLGDISQADGAGFDILASMYNSVLCNVDMENNIIEDSRVIRVILDACNNARDSLLLKNDKIVTDVLKKHNHVSEYIPFIDRTHNYTTDEYELLFNDMVLMFQLKRKRYTQSHDIVNQVVNLLDFVYLTNPEMYCNLVFAVINCSYLFSSVYCCDKKNLRHLVADDEKIETMQVDSLTSISLDDFGTVSYKKNDGEEIEITDGTGVGIYSFMLLLSSLCHDFGEFKRDVFNFYKDDSLNVFTKIQDMFKSCIGTDFCGSCLKLKSVRYAPVKNFNYLGFEETNYFGEINELGVGYSCKDYENYLLYKRCFGIQPVARKHFRRVVDMHYVTTDSFMAVFGKCASSIHTKANITVISNEEYDKLKKQSEVTRSLEERLRGRDDVSMLKKRISSLEDTNDALKTANSDLSDDIVKLNYMVSEKSCIIDDLRSKLASYEEKFGRFYDVDDIEEIEDSEDEGGVSLDEMVSLLNDFKIAIVGGRDRIVDYLRDKGMTNVIQLNEEQCHTGSTTTIQCDFFCIQTKFVGHKIVRNIESKYSKQKGEMFYYNGTNTDALIHVCYDFVTKWLDEE